MPIVASTVVRDMVGQSYERADRVDDVSAHIEVFGYGSVIRRIPHAHYVNPLDI